MNRAKTKRRDGPSTRGSRAAQATVTSVGPDSPVENAIKNASLDEEPKKSAAVGLDATMKENFQLQARNQELSSAMDQRFAEIAKLTELLIAAEKAVQEHKEEIARIAAENVALKKESAYLATQVSERHTRIIELESTLGRHQELLTELDALKAIDAQRLDELATLSANLDSERVLREKYERALSSHGHAKSPRLQWRLPKFNRSQARQLARLTNDLERIRSSDLFDANWYMEQNPDVRASGIDPAEHYLKFGANEERNPGPLFDTKHYLNTNADVVKAKMNPLLHYIDHGSAEGRSIKAVEGK